MKSKEKPMGAVSNVTIGNCHSEPQKTEATVIHKLKQLKNKNKCITSAKSQGPKKLMSKFRNREYLPTKMTH